MNIWVCAALCLLATTGELAAKPAQTAAIEWVDRQPETPDSLIGKRFETVANRSSFSGQYVVAQGRNIWNADTMPHKGARSQRLWRWASVTKQVVAVLVMQEVAKGRIDLDKPVGSYLPGFKSANASLMTVRQLLRHQSGLPNPDDTPVNRAGVPSYYTPQGARMHDTLSGYCAGPVKAAPGGNWAYNNCDYIVAGALLEAVTGRTWQQLVAERIARPLGLKTLAAYPTGQRTMRGTVNGQPEAAIDLATYGAAGGLYGSAADLLAFDRALMSGKLLPEAQRAEMWDGQPSLGFIALGQWVFEAPLKGCEKPVRIVERRGAIGGVQVRNFILPDEDIAVVAFTDRGEFDFGEIWQGSGFSHDLLSAAACQTGVKS